MKQESPRWKALRLLQRNDRNEKSPPMIGRLNNAIHSIQAAALLLGAASLLSRLLGVLRDRLLASHFGASRELDIYYAAFQIPDFIFTIFLLGAASAAIIPILLELYERSPEKARQLIRDTVQLFVTAAGGVLIIVAFAAPWIMRWIAPGFSDADRSIATMLTRMMLLSPLLLGLSGIMSSALQAFRRFFIFSLTSVVYNLGIIFGILALVPIFGLPGLALGVIIGAILHLIIQLPMLKTIGFSLPFPPFLTRKPVLSAPMRKILYLSLPRVAAMSVGNATTIILVAFASTLSVGSISVFQLANNIHFLPIGMFGVSFALAVYPSLNEHFLHRAPAAFFEAFSGTFRSILFWVLPSAVLFYVLRAQIVRVALGAGHFGWSDTRITAALLGIFSLAIIAESLMPLLIRSFYALENTRKPLLISIGSALLTVISALLLTALFTRDAGISHTISRVLRVDDLPHPEVLGLAGGIFIGTLTQAVLLMYVFRWEARRKLGSIRIIYHGSEMLKIASAAILAGGTAFAVLRAVTHFIDLSTFRNVLLQGATAGVAGYAVYGAILFIWRNREINNLIETIQRRARPAAIAPHEAPEEQSHETYG